MSKIVQLSCALFLFVASPVLAGPEPRCGYAIPTSIEVSDDLRRRMSMMLQSSATFRQQCQRLDVPGLHVQIRPDVQLFDRSYRARSIIRRSEDGELTAAVDIT